jgi:DNA replication and repair protein RecF
VLLRIIAGDDGAAPAVSKSFRVNGVPRRALEFIGEINVVSFSPEDVALVDGPPAGRRRYLDVTNAQMSSRYLRTLQRYGKVLVQRNSLLRHARESGRHDPSLSVWDEELAGAGAFLLQERARSINALGIFADRWFRDLGGWGQRLDIKYRPGIPDEEAAALREPIGEIDQSLGLIHAAFGRALAGAAAKERAVGMSLVGPHRDDLGFVVDGVDLNVYGSRGQQRLAALSLKLAEVDLLTQTTGSRPILLLDDVLSELDDVKQAAVLRIASGHGQTLLTVTSPDPARSALPTAAVLHLEAGAVDLAGRSA